MTRARRILLLASAATLLLAALLTLISGVGAPGAWRLGGPDAPEFPLTDLLPLWIAAAVSLGAATLTARPGSSEWTHGSQHLLRAAFSVAAYLVFADLFGATAATVLFPILAAFLTRRASIWLSAVASDPADRSYTLANLAMGLTAGGATLSLAVILPHAFRDWFGLGPTDAPWIFFWIGYSLAALYAWRFLRSVRRARWFLLSLGWGAAASVWHNWAVSGLHFIAILTALLSLFLLSRVTRPRKQPKPPA